ncbi:citrate synthase [Bogoriella caseilytica]|uniref:citrate synthase (unknown stereospecificity) n=1 Tax=Bogoriella caseilytica TaxID=56055 RepID=A0A3N2BC41_9MICO|nr:citrate synthase [Bogoriella caseilytica]
MTTAQAAEALGVRPSTVYAYVSRGVLGRVSEVVEGRRVSFFDRAEVLGLAAERARSRAGVVSTLIESDVTSLDPRGRLLLRGHDIGDLAGQGFEQAAALVWQDDSVPWPPVHPDWRRAAEQVAVAGAADPRDRLVLALTLAGAADEHREDLGREHVLTVARGAIQLAPAVVGVAGGDAPNRPTRGGVAPGAPVAEQPGRVAGELWRALAGRTAGPAEFAAIETALVVLMDHELAASTLAVRIAASTRADPWSCLLAGLAVLRGSRHGGAGIRAAVLLREWMERGGLVGPPAAGFGHAVYEQTDPRAELLLERVAALSPEGAAAVESLSTEVLRRHGAWPNVDLALAALTVAGGLDDRAPAVIFAVARMVGWTAHMLEEQPHGLRYRPRAVAGG